jgi:hypothetical protein
MTGTFSGIKTLQFTPDNKFAYCYSGEFTSDANMELIMQFETGSYYLVSEIRFCGFTDMGSPASGSTGACRVVFGNEITTTINTKPELVMLQLKTDGASEDMPFSDSGKLIIPPFTNVQFFVDASSTSASYDGGIVVTAEVKGTVEQFDLELK